MTTTPQLIYHNVSQSQLSLACRYGGITINGKRYDYNPVNDTLVLKGHNVKKPKKDKPQQGELI